MSNLWSQVLWSTTEGACGGSVANVFLAETKVCQFDVSFRVEEEVLQLFRGGEGGERREEEGGEGRGGEGGRRRGGQGRRREERGGAVRYCYSYPQQIAC